MIRARLGTSVNIDYIYSENVLKGFPLQTMKVHGVVDARLHIYTATTLGRCRVANPTLGRLYPWGMSLILILYEAQWTPGPV